MPDHVKRPTRDPDRLPTSVEALTALANGRSHITTAECAKTTNSKPQTLRKNYCLTGHCFGIRPVKIGNRLNWPVEGVGHVLVQGGDQ